MTITRFITIALLCVSASSSLHAEEKPSPSNPESYKWKLEGQFWYPTPTVTVAGDAAQAPISFNRVLGFQSYSTFNASADWHFKRKHHLLFSISPNQSTRSTVLQQTITFRDQTFLAGSSVTSELKNYSFSPGYRYDIIHRDHGHLGITAQVNVMDIKASITAKVLQPGQINVSSASGGILAPLPVAGPEARLYMLKDHLFVDGNIKGMYFFGYGNFISTGAKLGATLGRHVDLIAGYTLGSHLIIHGTSSRMDVRSTQRGPTAGLAFNF
jgi:hypothetical protein